MPAIPSSLAFILVSLSLGQLGDGLNIFQGIYLVGIGWNEASVGLALSLMGFTALLVQTFAGDLVDRTSFDRRIFLGTASVVTACSALTVLFVHKGNTDHALIFSSKIIEGISSSFIGPCIAALTLSNYGPIEFDKVMASNILWGHIGSVLSAVLAGFLGYVLYPNIKYCFLVIAFSAVMAVFFVQFLPEGDPLMGRGFHQQQTASASGEQTKRIKQVTKTKVMEASSYWEVFSDPKTCILCLTGFFFHFANANVLLVLGELMGQDNDDGSASRSAIPLIAGAIVTAQVTMSIATVMGDKLTQLGWGRKILFTFGLATLPLRCALIILWKNSGDTFLLSTQVLDGLGGGFFGLLHPMLVADITFGSGRFNVVMGLTASCFGLGGTLSNLLGQIVVEKFGHVTSLVGSLSISFIPLALFGYCMPETYGQRGKRHEDVIEISYASLDEKGTMA